MLQSAPFGSLRAFRSARIALAVSTLALFVSCRLVAAPPPPAIDPLADNPKLDQKVKIVAEGIPIRDLLVIVSSKTGVILSAREDVADEKVIIFGPPRPLKAVLSDLATLFNDHWTHDRTKDGKDEYTLLRGNAEHNYEDRLANAGTERMLAELDKQVKALDETPEQLAKRPENDAIRRRIADSQTRFATSLYSGLNSQQQHTLFAQHRVNIPFSALNGSQQVAVRDLYARLIADQQQELRRRRERLPNVVFDDRILKPEDLDNDALRFFVDSDNGGTNVAVSLGANLSAALPIASFPPEQKHLLPAHGNPYTAKPVASDAALPDMKAIAATSQESSWRDALRLLSEKSGTSIMADFYRSRRVSNVSPSKEAFPDATAASHALDAFCCPHNTLWWMQGTTLLLRNRVWYQDSRYEIPDRWMLSVSKTLRAQKERPTYNDVLRVLELTPEQTYSLQSGFYDKDAAGITEVQAREKEIAAARDLLSLLQEHAMPSGNAAQIPTWSEACDHNADKTLAKFMLTSDNAKPQSHPFNLLICCLEDKPQTGEDGYRHVTLRMLGGFDIDPWQARDPLFELQSLSGHNPVLLILPLSLPDNRRDKTVVAVVP